MEKARHAKKIFVCGRIFCIIFILASVVVSAACTFSQGFEVPVLGLEDDAAFTRRMHPETAAYEYMNRNTPADSRVMLLRMNAMVYQLERDYETDAILEGLTMMRMLDDSGTLKEL